MGHILENKHGNKCACIHEIIELIMVNMKMKIKKGSLRYDINRPKPIDSNGS